ncbi:MAG: condensation domain-containing protein [Pyrinomonadaceae bacterium]
MTQQADRLERLKNLSPAKRALLLKALRREASQAAGHEVIPRLEGRDSIPLSFAQQSLWFLHQLDPDDPSYNVPTAVRMAGPLDLDALRRALDEIVRRHEVLRTTFANRGGEWVQVIHPPTPVAVAVESLQGLDAGEREREAERLSLEEATRPFNLLEAPVLRVKLLRLAEEECVLLLTLHHIVADGWSVGVLIKEVGVLYEAYTAGKQSPLAEPSLQYADYAAWQRGWLKGKEFEAQLAYWRRHLAGAPASLELPIDRPRNAGADRRGAMQSLVLDEGLTEELRAFSQREGVTLFMTLLAAYEVLLYRYTNQSDILVGTPIAGRNRTQVEELMGAFANMLALRTNVSGGLSFRELLAQVREVSLQAYAHQDAPFDKLVELLQPKRKPHHTPLFQTTFVLQNVPLSQTLTLPRLRLTPYEVGLVQPQYDLTLTIWEEPRRLTARLKHLTALFEPETITRVLKNYEEVLRCVVGQPEVRLDAVELSAGRERSRQTMDSKERADAALKKLLSVKPKGVSIQKNTLVRTSYFDPEEKLPLVVEPTEAGVSLPAWAKGNMEFVEAELLKHGAILFRGFQVTTLGRFEQFVTAISPQLFEYRERSSPRTAVGKQIYTSTDHPPDQWIEMHSEHSYSHQWPLKIWFGCLEPAARGGETPVASNREVLARLDPQLVARFEEKKVMYVRNYGDGLGVSWQTAFQTADRGEVGEYCRRAGIEFEWKDEDHLRTWQVREAVRRHPRSGEPTWFNHLNIYNVATLDPGVRKSLMTMFREEDLPFNTYYGDGSKIEESVLTEIREAYTRSLRAFAWEQGDVLMLDNMFTAHGRKPYGGSRKVVVAMGDLFGGYGS